MNQLNQSELLMLMQKQGAWCVSIYLPTHPNSLEVRQDTLRLKNLLRDAETQLITLGLPEDILHKMLRPARALAQDDSFWQHQGEGLALFLTEGFFQWYTAPLPFPELCVVTERFHLKPLLRWLTSDGEFHLLTLSQKQVRLWAGTRYSLTDITPADLPQGLTAALGEAVTEKHLQTRSTASAGSGRASTVMHGSNLADEHKPDLKRYFQQVNQHLNDVLATARCPLVLAGVEYLQPLYQEVSHWPQLFIEGVAGNPDRMNADELHKAAWALVHPHYQKIRQQAMERYQQMQGTGRTTDRVQEAVTAASQGRVDTLFVPVGVHRWGNFDEAESTLVMHADAKPGAEDLLDLAALETLSKGGRVFVVLPDQMPGQAPVAAIYRY